MGKYKCLTGLDELKVVKDEDCVQIAIKTARGGYANVVLPPEEAQRLANEINSILMGVYE